MRKTAFTAVFLTALASTTSLYAQEIDYSGLEHLFGEAVTTSATGKPQRVSETPVSMEIISSEEIQRSGALDIPEILRRVAGVDVIRNFKGHADVNVRGFNQPFSNRLLVLINGRQVYMDNFGMTLWHSLPVQMSEIKQIEIVRGPNTSLFGFNAASGVVNIVTFNPLHDNIKVIETRAGTQAHLEASGVTTMKVNHDLAVRFSTGRALSDGFSGRSMIPAQSKDNALEKTALNVDVLWQASKRSSLRIESGYNQQETASTYPYYLSSRADTITRHIMADYTYDALDYGLWDLRVYRNELAFQNNVEQDNYLNVVQLSNLISLTPKHTLRFGTEYRHNALEGRTVGTDPGKFTMAIYSGNTMWDWKINEKLSFTNAARVDHWISDREGNIAANDTFLGITASDAHQTNTEFSFNSGLLYKATNDSSYRLSIARGLHVPSLDELALDIATTPGAEFYGNPHLDTEVTTVAELGYNRKLAGKNITLGSNLFYERVESVILPTVRSLSSFGGRGGAEADLTFENVGNADAYGIELIAKGKLWNNHLYWHANYSYLFTQDHPDGQSDHFIDFARTQPKHKVNLAAGYTVGKWELDTDIHYVSGTHYLATVGDIAIPRKEAEIDAYVTLNARLGYKLSQTTKVSLDGYNLLDEHRERPAFPFVIGASGSGGGSNILGRTVLMTFRHSF